MAGISPQMPVAGSGPATYADPARGQDLSRPFALVSSLFFMWAVAVNLNDVLIPHLKKACQLTDLESSLIQVSFFGAYFIMALPAGYVMRRLGYRTGILLGLGLSALGAALFYPAASTREYGFFLAALFVMASGSATLETAANPYATVLGRPDRAAFRLNLAQTLNALGTVLTPLLGKYFILSGIEHTPEELAAMAPAVREAYLQSEAAQVQIPYLILAGVYVAVGVAIYAARLPDVRPPADEVPQGGVAGAQGKTTLGAMLAGVWARPHARAGVIAQFFYVGAQVCLASFMIRYVQAQMPGMGERGAADLLVYHLLGFALGRVAGTALMSRVAPQRLLVVFALAALVLTALAMFTGGTMGIAALVAVGFFNSIIFPTIFALTLEGLGDLTKPASSLLVMSIVGGALLPAAMGLVSDQSSISVALLVPLIAYGVVAAYGATQARLRARVAT